MELPVARSVGTRVLYALNLIVALSLSINASEQMGNKIFVGSQFESDIKNEKINVFGRFNDKTPYKVELYQLSTEKHSLLTYKINDRGKAHVGSLDTSDLEEFDLSEFKITGSSKSDEHILRIIVKIGKKNDCFANSDGKSYIDINIVDGILEKASFIDLSKCTLISKSIFEYKDSEN